MEYTIDEHKHRFAAWAASRAASVKGCRFSVEQGKKVLEAAGMRKLISDPNNLPLPECMDATHRQWRNAVINAAMAEGLNFTHGVTAKLINVYLKAGIVCEECHEGGTSKGDVTNAICFKCHIGYSKLAERTSKITPNPHESHIGYLECVACHHIHKLSEDYCGECHKFSFKVP